MARALAGGDALGDRLTQFLAEVPLECVRAAARIADLAHERLGLRVTQSLILPIADHLQFALQRHRDGIHTRLSPRRSATPTQRRWPARSRCNT